jgi:NAD(P)-dependent dehydrogenase (short-subunit alcohol dehydrogenase family)
MVRFISEGECYFSMEASPKAQYVLITGCSSGFGRQMVHRFLAKGWNVMGTTRHPERLKQEHSQKTLHILPCNVATQSDREQVVQAVNAQCPAGLHCLINNAGYGLAGPLEALSEEQIRQQFEVNFFAPLFLTRDLLPSLRKAQGRVINISSVLGFTGMPMQSLYAASKFALEGLSESLHYELAAHGVQVTLVEPGGFRTGFADSMDWAAGQMPDHPLYHQQFEGYRGFLKRVSTQGKGKDPSQVAEIIVRLASKPKMPLRVRVGEDTQALYYLRRTLPQQVADSVLKRISSRILQSR